MRKSLTNSKKSFAYPALTKGNKVMADIMANTMNRPSASPKKTATAKIIQFPKLPASSKLIPFGADELRFMFGFYSLVTASKRVNFLLKLDSNLASFCFFADGDAYPYLRIAKIKALGATMFTLLDVDNMIISSKDKLEDIIQEFLLIHHIS